MDDTNDSAPQSAQAAPAEATAPAAGKRERKPPSEEQAKLAASRKRLKRQLEKLLTTGDAESLERAARTLAGEGEEAAQAPAEVCPAETEKKPEAAPAPQPTAAEAAAMLPVAQAMVAMVAAPLVGTRYDPMRPKPNPLGGEEIVPAKALTEALAPVLAKYLPAAVTTPEGQLALVAAMWLGPPTLELVMERVRGGGDGASIGAGAKAA